MRKRIVALCLLTAGTVVSGHLLAAGKSVEDTIKRSLSRAIPVDHIDSISPSPLEGVSEVLVGMNVFYVSNDGKYVLEGKLIEMKSRTNLTDQLLSGLRKKSLAKVDEKDMIIFPASKERHVITVFTDIDCGYCRKLHSQIDKFNDKGITVRYMSFPRSGPDTPSFDKAVSVWCSDDRNKAITEAKSGTRLPKKTCDNPVRKEYDLGLEMGVTGTPAIVLEDGSLVPGYLPPKRLLKELDAMAAGKS